MTDAIHYEKGQDNTVVLTMDMPGQNANTMNGIYHEAMAKIIARLGAEKEGIAGVALVSAKRIFFTGGDLNELIRITKADASAFYQGILELRGQLRHLEALNKPVVAAINDAALGGDWEICLACHHCIALDNPGVQLGLPKVTLGLLPGGGGVVRMVRLPGPERALPCLAEGKKACSAGTLKARLIHELADSSEEMLEKTRAWILANPAVKQPWDSAGHKISGGAPTSPDVAQMLAITPSVLHDKTKGCFPTLGETMCVVVEGAQVDFDTVQLTEARYFTELTTGQVAKNMIGAFWFQLNEVNAGKSRPQGYPVRATREVGVIGTRTMGTDIAYILTATGTEVVLEDVSLETAEGGEAYSARPLDRKVARGHLFIEKRGVSLARIAPSVSEAGFKGCSSIIETVFEDRALKDKVTAEAEEHTPVDTAMVPDASTLPIADLAQAVTRPGRFTGLYLLSPMDKMPLVEIIRSEKASDETLARSFSYVLQIKETPIVVNDSRGFFTSWIFSTFISEGIAIFSEGVNTVMIGNQTRQAGMPVGPLAISDEVSLSLMTRIHNWTTRDLEAEGRALPAHPAFTVIDLMVNEYKRPGEAVGAGFYDCPTSGREHLWAGLKGRFGKPDAQISAENVRDRLLFIQAIGTVCCVGEGILHSTADANIGSIFGIGFIAWSRGALQFISQYGLKGFIAHAQYLIGQYGERFKPPTLLLEKTAKGELF